MGSKKNLWFFVPLLGTVLCIVYVAAATRDVVYSDYIRLINSYLPDVWNPKKFFVADVLTRIPVNYLGRIINVTVFGYSTTFDMMLGVLCLGASGIVLTFYCRKENVDKWNGVVPFLSFLGILLSLPGV